MIRVIVPVYNAAKPLAACLEALRRTAAGAPVTLVDDASTDPTIAPMLDRFAADRKSVSVVTNPSNLGFVRSVNTAMSGCSDDVVLLNADTVVAGNWLAAMARCAASDARIATITPFSNNAEICSLPTFCQSNPLPADACAVAAAIHACAPPDYPELPTGVGFCLFIRRACWDALGGFDEAFGHGYGEENDFCRRAAIAGWRNVLCDDAYVGHVGGQSFSELGLAPGGENLRQLVKRHPDYNRLVAEFIQQDPLAGRRAEILLECERRGLTLPAI